MGAETWISVDIETSGPSPSTGSMLSIGAWAVRSPSFTLEAPVGTDSVILGLSTFFDGEAAGDLRARYELRLGEHPFHARVADGTIELGRGPSDDPDAIVDTDVDTLRALIWDARDLDEALRAGDVAIEGDHDAVARLLGLFPQPQPVAG